MSGNNFFEELQKMTASALNTMTGSAKHFEETFKQNIESVLRKMDFVKREELDLLREALAKALEKQKELENEINQLKGNKNHPSKSVKDDEKIGS